MISEQHAMDNTKTANVDATARVVAWLLTALPNDEREYAGNTGYDDIISEAYHYDNKVQNSRRIKVGDVAVLRSTRMEGIARITQIQVSEGVKVLFSCPSCKRASSIKSRASLTPKYRCFKCGTAFDVPDTKPVQVTKFSAYFGSSFVPMPDALSLATLRDACINHNPQLAMQQINLRLVVDLLADRYPDALPFLGYPTDPIQEKIDSQVRQASDALQSQGEFDPVDQEDARKKVLRSIAARAGQSGFRNKLLRAYGGQCAVTGCEVEQVLEAAHIVPYKGKQTNHIKNGVLLRADIHTLFDRGLVVINSEMRIVFHPILCSSSYAPFHGRILRLPSAPAAQPSPAAFAQHYALHRGEGWD